MKRLLFTSLICFFLTSCESDDENISDESNNDNTSTNLVTDIDGNQYETVTIGTQEWMAKNLTTTKYSNGDIIELTEDSSFWEATSTGAFCFYDNDISYDNFYGKLYNFHAVIDDRNICPDGWHVPTDSDWGTLVSFVSNNGHNDTEGKALKSSSGWYNTGNGTDSFDFDGKPGGYRKVNGGFSGAQDIAYWWTATSLPNGEVTLRGLGWGFDDVVSYNQSKQLGLSVRCLKNQ